jgi:hypothetical protein
MSAEKRVVWICMLVLCGWGVLSFAQPTGSAFTLARLKYSGGGDWYNDPSMLPNIQMYLSRTTGIDASRVEARVSPMDEHLYAYPVLFVTGHGRITFTAKEAERLRTYLTHGGFLYADDDYGMDSYFRDAMKAVFPGKSWIELPYSHDIYHTVFDFSDGLPKIHKHDGGAPRGYGLFHNGELVCFYSYNTNISDGWADPDVHKDPAHIREQALKMGVNILVYAMTH